VHGVKDVRKPEKHTDVLLVPGRISLEVEVINQNLKRINSQY